MSFKSWTMAALVTVLVASLVAQPAFASVGAEEAPTQDPGILTLIMCVLIPGCAKAGGVVSLPPSVLPLPVITMSLTPDTTFLPYTLTGGFWRKALWWFFI